MKIEMSKKVIVIVLYGLIGILITGCSDDEPGEMNDGISISGLETVEGIRGSSVTVSFTANGIDGIQSISAEVDGSPVSISVPAGTTNYTGSFDYEIPGNAILASTYPVIITATDTDGDVQNASSSITVGPVLSSSPETYTFDRNGNTTVSYNGQNERLDQVEEIKAYLISGDGGAALSASILNDAYANTNNDGNGFFSFTSTKQLKGKSFQPDLDDMFLENLFAGAEAASNSDQMASDGVAGLIVRENSGKTVLVDANGREFTQMIEKGLMGTVMYNQIYNTYFSEERMGDDVENTALRDDSNYTDMEHHWDEAFGYWNAPLDFTSNWPSERGSEDRFWSHYSNVVDPFLGTNDAIMNAFKDGRTAIVNNDLEGKNAARTIAIDQLDLVAAATAVHYINSTLSAINAGHIGEAFHTLSEAWTFSNALRYNPDRRISLDDIELINETHFGANGNFWNVSVDGLNIAKNMIVTAYPELESSKDEL